MAGTTSATLNGTPASSPVVASDAGLSGEVAVQVNGVVGGPFPNPDATRKFRVATGSETARYPSAPGRAVDIVSRSGTNSIHGSAFEFARNGFFNAENDILAQPYNLNRNQFGGAVGAPIIKNRWFLFGDYQRTNITSSVITGGFVPTTLERSGVFTNVVTNQQVQLPVSPVVTDILAYLPLANGPNGLYTIGCPITTVGNQWTIMSDLTLGQHRLFARHFADP